MLPKVLDEAYEVCCFKILIDIFLLLFHICSFLFSSSLYQLMGLAPHIPIERCRLVKYDIKDKVMDQSLDLDEVIKFFLFIIIIINIVS